MTVQRCMYVLFHNNKLKKNTLCNTIFANKYGRKIRSEYLQFTKRFLCYSDKSKKYNSNKIMCLYFK